MSAGKRFREALAQEKPLQVIGAINANHALMAKRVGYRAIYLSGGGVAAEVTGFGPAETVLIRWRVGSSYTQVGTLTTAANGTGSVNVLVPTNAALGANTVRAEGTAFAAQTSAVTVSEPVPPAVTLDPTRGTVNTNVAYTVANFPANASGTIVWRRISGSTIAVGSLRVPPSPSGIGVSAASSPSLSPSPIAVPPATSSWRSASSMRPRSVVGSATCSARESGSRGVKTAAAAPPYIRIATPTWCQRVLTKNTDSIGFLVARP